MKTDAWGRPTVCAFCGDALKRHEGRGRPRKRCKRKACELASQRERRAKANNSISGRNVGCCPECGEYLLLPHRRDCPSRAEARAG